MKKIYLFILMYALASSALAQQTDTYYHGIMHCVQKSVLLEGKQTNCMVVAVIENFSPASKAGIQVFDLITAIDGEPVNEDTFWSLLRTKSNVVLNIKRLGNQTLDIAITSIPTIGVSVHEAWYAIHDGEGRTRTCVTYKLLDSDPIEIMSDPEADLYGYATFDFEFTGNNILQQKEIAPVVEDNLTNKGLKRDRDNPDILIFIEYYSDKIEQYIPPSQNISTRYGTSYNVWTKRHETRQYIESYQTGDYTRVEYLSKLSIAMVDAKKMQTGGDGDFTVWQADYKTLYSEKANHKEFGEAIGRAMLYGFPFKSVTMVDIQRYWFTGILYDWDIPGKVNGVIPDSPADRAGIKAGDIIKKCSAGNNKMFKESYRFLDQNHNMNGYSYEYKGFQLTMQYNFLANNRGVHNRDPFANTYMNYRYRFAYNSTTTVFGFVGSTGRSTLAYDSNYTTTDYDKNPPVFTVMGSDKKTRKVTITPVFQFCKIIGGL
ncbi:MAG: DUF4136 domain-containing protein [Bacteroidales bacterium]|jgi:hypothetical protein|nr:DUF4136 domain-containing protein [Bacteroidales bacterium]